MNGSHRPLKMDKSVERMIPWMPTAVEDVALVELRVEGIHAPVAVDPTIGEGINLPGATVDQDGRIVAPLLVETIDVLHPIVDLLRGMIEALLLVIGVIAAVLL